MAERLKAPVLKTGDGLSRPWVQIPPSPPKKKALLARAFLFADRDGCGKHAGSKHRRERCLTGSRDVTLARRVEGTTAGMQEVEQRRSSCRWMPGINPTLSAKKRPSLRGLFYLRTTGYMFECGTPAGSKSSAEPVLSTCRCRHFPMGVIHTRQRVFMVDIP